MSKSKRGYRTVIFIVFGIFSFIAGIAMLAIDTSEKTNILETKVDSRNKYYDFQLRAKLTGFCVNITNEEVLEFYEPYGGIPSSNFARELLEGKYRCKK